LPSQNIGALIVRVADGTPKRKQNAAEAPDSAEASGRCPPAFLDEKAVSTEAAGNSIEEAVDNTEAATDRAAIDTIEEAAGTIVAAAGNCAYLSGPVKSPSHSPM
jgi:hypothetical protein